MWNFFRLENEHLNNCGQFRAIKDIPLPFHIHVEGSSDDEEDEDDEEENGGLVGRTNKNGKSGVTLASSKAVISEEGTSSPNGTTSEVPASLDKRNMVRSPSALSGRTISRSNLEDPANSIHNSIHSTGSKGDRQPSLRNRSSQLPLAPFSLQRSNTFVNDALTEAGLGEDTREQLASANKFFDRRDFDSRIEGSVEGLFRIRNKSTVSMNKGGEARDSGTKNNIFGWKSNADEDDTDDDDDVYTGRI